MLSAIAIAFLLLLALLAAFVAGMGVGSILEERRQEDARRLTGRRELARPRDFAPRVGRPR